MREVRTTCAYCGVGCGIAAKVTAERSVTIVGDADHPANFGRLCSKGTYLSETVGLAGRLLQPMIGDQQVSWDRALDDVADRMRDTIDRYGPDSVAFYVSGQLLTEDYYVVNKLAKGFIGTANIDTNSRLCMASAVAAHNRAFGEDVVPCSYEDLEQADLILLVGSNTAWCHPVLWQRIEAAREQRGTKLVVIDPRRTETAERADLHIAIAPDGDVRLFNALLDEMAVRGVLDTTFLRDSCKVPDGFFAGLERNPGIDREIFAQFAGLVEAHPRMVTMFSQGANQSVCGTDKGNAIINLHLATGRIGKPGAGPFSITGQPNAMGGREVGGLANMLACHLGFSHEERQDVACFWNAPNICAGPGLKAVDMFRAVHEGRIRFLWIMASNPAVSMPDADFVREALARCETLVVSDVMTVTDTSHFADIRLPALAWGEKDGTVTNSERRISRQRALFDGPGEARADWAIVCDVARRLGHANAFAFDGPAAIFREFAAMTGLAARRGMALDLTAWSACSDGAYDVLQPFQWGGARPLEKGFSFPDRKARLVAVSPQGASESNPAYPLTLNTGRYRDQWHTMTRTGLSPKLSVHRREPIVEVHSGDAERFGLIDRGLARVTTAQGEATYRVAVSEAQQQGQIFVPMHFTDQTASAGRTGRLVHQCTDAVSGQPAFKNVPCAIAPLRTDWQAFLLSREEIAPACTYWVRAPVAGGWLYELAGDGAFDAAALLPHGPRSEVSDRSRGMMRIAVTGSDGALAAALYVTRNGLLPAREWIVKQFAAPSAAGQELLAGRPAEPAPDRGKIVCLCFDVGEKDILSAVRSGAGSVKQVSAATRAGTNCGSCRPIIARLLDEAKQYQEETVQ